MSVRLSRSLIRITDLKSCQVSCRVFRFLVCPRVSTTESIRSIFRSRNGQSPKLNVLIPASAQPVANPDESIINSYLDIGLSEEVLQSFPAFSNSEPYPNPITNATAQQLSYKMNESLSLSSIAITFQDPKMVDNFSLEESTGLLFSGAGIPLLTTVGFEFNRFWRERQRRPVVRHHHPLGSRLIAEGH